MTSGYYKSITQIWSTRPTHLEKIIKVESRYGVRVRVEMAVEMLRKVALHVDVAEDVVFELFEEIVEVEMEVVGASTAAEVTAGSHVVLLTLVRVGQHFVR